MDRAYFVNVDGADYRLVDGTLPSPDYTRGIFTIRVVRANGEESFAYSRSRSGPYTFKLR